MNIILPLIFSEGKESLIVSISATVHLNNFDEEPDFDFTSIKHKGVDLLPLLDAMPETSNLLEYLGEQVISAAREKHLKSVQ
jgi:hypothetical protein